MKYGKLFCYLLGIGIHLLFWGSLYYGFLNPFFCDSTHRSGQASDFFTHYQASFNYWQGRSLYQQIQLSEEKVVPYCYDKFRFFPSSPWLVGAWITSFSPWRSYWIWILINEILLGLMLFFAWRWEPTRFHYSFLLGMAFTPLYLEWYMGQFSFVVAASLFFIGYGLSQKKAYLTAFAFYGSVFIKYYGVILIPFFAWNFQRFKALWFGFLLLLGITFIPYFSQRPEELKLLQEAHALGGSHGGNLGLRALLYTLGDLLHGQRVMRQIPDYRLPPAVNPHERPWFSRLLYDYLWLLWFGLVAWRTLSVDRSQDIAVLSLWILLFFLLSKDVWEHHYVVLIPVFFFWNAQENLGRFVRWCFLFLAIPTPFFGMDVALPPTLDPEPYWSNLEVLLYHSSKSLPVLFLFLYIYFKSAPASSPTLSVENPVSS